VREKKGEIKSLERMKKSAKAVQCRGKGGAMDGSHFTSSNVRMDEGCGRGRAMRGVK
jgi:hypothetical protein